MFSSLRERLRYTFGAQIAWWYAVIFLASALALVLMAYLLLAAALRQHDREFVQRTLIEFAAAYVRGGSEMLRREIQRAQIAGTEGPLFVRAVGRGEDVVFVSLPERWRQFDTSQLARQGARQDGWTTLDPGGDDPNPVEVLTVRLPDGTLFQVGKSTEHRAEILGRFRRMLLVAAGAILLIGLAGGAVLTRSALAPLRALADTIAAILRTGRTTARVPVADGGDVLAELARQVNAMLDRIDRVVGGMRDALDNVAHDLRTPLARVRVTAESALASHEPRVLQGALADAVEEIDRVVVMLNTMMDISEAQTGTMALHRARVALADLARQAAALYEDVADEQGVGLEVTVPPEIVLFVDGSRMRQALANLLDNAVKYTGRGGSVTVRAWLEDRRVVVTVSDTGIGIAAEDLPHVWERLYRADKSRSTRGLGLGLSLVKAIVEAHGGTVAIASAAGAGTQVTLRLPSTPESAAAQEHG